MVTKVKELYDLITDAIDFEMRGGHHPDLRMDALERQIAEDAYNLVLNSPAWGELGFKTAYNFRYLNYIYGSPNPEIQKLLYELQPYPEMIEMEVTQSVCPLKCKFCELTYWNEKPIQLEYDKFVSVMDQFPNLKWAGINALGDPFTNPRYYDMVKYLDDKGVAQEIYMTTQLQKEEDMKKFVDLHGMVLTKISFDGATKETYERVHQGGDFDKAIRNVKALDKYKRQAGKFFPQLEFHYIICKENAHEAEMFIDLIDSLNVNCTGIMFSRLLHNYPEVNDIYMEIPQEKIDSLIQHGKNLGIPVTVNGDARSQKPPAYGCLQWTMPYIFPDGTVISCCNGNEANMRPKQREWSMGNVFEKPFREIWNGEKYTALRSALHSGNPENYLPVCKNLCAVHDVNCKLAGV